MRNHLRQNFIKAFMLLAITNAVFVGGVAHAYDFNWDWWPTPNLTGGTATVIKNNQYWEFTLSGATNGGVSLGMPYYFFNTTPLATSPWSVRYEVTSIGGSGVCHMRPTLSSTNALTGANTIVLSAGSATTSLLTFTSPNSQNGQQAVTIHRSSGTCQVTIRIYEVLASDGTVLWNPQSNLVPITLNVTTATSGSPIPSEFDVNLQNDQLWNFLLLFALFMATLFGLIKLLSPFYVRK